MNMSQIPQDMMYSQPMQPTMQTLQAVPCLADEINIPVINKCIKKTYLYIGAGALVLLLVMRK